MHVSPLPCVFQRLTKVVNTALVSVIGPLARLLFATLINTQPEGGFTDTTAMHKLSINVPTLLLQARTIYC